MRTRKSKPTKRPKAIIRPLDPSDPRHLSHPCHSEQWSELMRAIFRAMAERDFELQQTENLRKKGKA